MKVTKKQARRIGNIIGIDWNKYDSEQFRMGMEVELEHGAHDPQTNVTNSDPVMTGKIALAHLKEMPDYYTRLKKMEAAAEPKIVNMPSKIGGYFAEMHQRAAKELGLPYPYGADTVAVLKTLSPKARKWHEKHGRLEYKYMKQGMSYIDAHTQTLLDMKDYDTRKEARKDAERMVRIAVAVKVKKYRRRL